MEKIPSGVPALSWNFIEVNCHKIRAVGRSPRCWPKRLWPLFSWLIPTVPNWPVDHLPTLHNFLLYVTQFSDCINSIFSFLGKIVKYIGTYNAMWAFDRRIYALQFYQNLYKTKYLSIKCFHNQHYFLCLEKYVVDHVSL